MSALEAEEHAGIQWLSGPKFRAPLTVQIQTGFILSGMFLAAWIVYVLGALSGSRLLDGSAPTISIIVPLVAGWTGYQLMFRCRKARIDERWSRVSCVGNQSRFERFGDISDEFFEPLFFYAPFTVHSLQDRLSRYLLIPGVTLALLLKSICFGPIWDWRGSNGMMGFLVLATGVSWAWFLPEALQPTYFRLVPGRLDILRFSCLRSGPRDESTVSIDLSSARVHIDACYGRLLLHDGRVLTELPITLVPARERLIHGLLRACISTKTPGPTEA